VEATAETHLSTTANGNSLEFQTTSDLILDPDLQPQTYTWKQSGARASSLEINFLSSPATATYRTVDGRSDVRQFDLPKDVIVMDDNVLSHYEILVERYDRSSHGKQTFTAFIPQEALPGKLRMEKTGEEKIEIGGKKIKAGRYTVTTELAQIDVWADKDGHVQRISIPAVHLEADRR
jgi:predicted transcriptional regulator